MNSHASVCLLEDSIRVLCYSIIGLVISVLCVKLDPQWKLQIGNAKDKISVFFLSAFFSALTFVRFHVCNANCTR